MVKARDEVTWFANAGEWRTWLEHHHDTATEIWVGIRKRHIPTGVSESEAFDEALCFGWIDGITHSVDADGYTNRFTPRKPKSNWSAVNLKRIEELIAEGRVHEAGMRAYENRDQTRTGAYANEQQQVELGAEFQARFEANAAAWAWFQSKGPGYRRQAIWWVISAKRPETRERRLATLIEDSAHGREVKPLARD